MMNKKGSSWWTWIWIIVFVVIMISVARHSYYRQATYNDITGRITNDYNEELQRQQEETYYQQQIQEKQQRQYEQEQYEKELRRQQEQQRQLEEKLQQQEEAQQYISPSCQSGYTNEYKCSGDWSQKKYQYSDCSSVWIMYEGCQYGCGEDGKCRATSLCTVGFKCKDSNYKGYQKSDCSWDFLEYCNYGCESGKCNPEPQQQCSSGWECKNSSHYGYRYSDCSWSSLNYCSGGCEYSSSGYTQCITKIPCTDSDHGQDYNIKGCVIYGSAVLKEEATKCDRCDLNPGYEKYVIEYYCTDNGVSLINHKCLYGCSDGKCNLEPQTSTITVSYVSDGDTIKLSSGEEVRLIGINAPELGQSCSSEATNKLKELVLGKEVTLEQDVDNKDQYGRLLRYVYVGDTFVNLEVVRLGLAHKYEYGSNTKYSSQFEQAENEAKQNEGCLWKSSQETYISDQCIYITNFHFNAAGNDNYNLNDEYVTLGNRCSYSIDMISWTIKDETASHLYTIPTFTFQSGSTFTLFTGTGTNTNSALYWGRTSDNYAAIWNNNGDTLFLRDSKGNLVLSQSYSGY